MGELKDADPLAETVAWLQAHPVIASEFGSPDHVSGVMEAPWPHIVVLPGEGGDFGDLTWVITPEVVLEVLGRPDGYPGRASLRRLALTAVDVCVEMADRATAPGQPVVSRVVPSGVLAWAPLTTGQPRWVMGLLVTMHPPVD